MYEKKINYQEYLIDSLKDPEKAAGYQFSSDEKFIEFVRGFLHFSPSEYLQIKLKNTQLVHYAIDFLKNHTDFTGYIVPDFSQKVFYMRIIKFI